MSREREMLTELNGSLRERRAWWFKIPDMPHFEGAKFRFDLAKPFDGVGVFAGRAFAIEAKVIPRFQQITERHFRPVQLQGLDAWAAAGGRAFAFLFLWEPTRGAEQVSGRLPVHAKRRLYVLDWAWFRARGSVVTKAELVAMPHYERYGVKTEAGNRAYRWNVDLWLIDLVMG